MRGMQHLILVARRKVSQSSPDRLQMESLREAMLSEIIGDSVSTRHSGMRSLSHIFSANNDNNQKQW